MDDLKGAIMQPTYLPWAGFFNLISEVDVFVILDDVQFEKNSWQSRNRILQNGKELMLSVPIASQSHEACIKDLMISSNSKWKKKHLQTIQQAYAKSPYKVDLMSLLEPVYNTKSNKLIDYSWSFIKRVVDWLEFDTRIVFSSDYDINKSKSSRLVELCNTLGISHYLSPKGSREYIESDGLIPNSNLLLSYQEYIPKAYQQINSRGFATSLSIVDVIACLGKKGTQAYIRTKIEEGK